MLLKCGSVAAGWIAGAGERAQHGLGAGADRGADLPFDDTDDADAYRADFRAALSAFLKEL